MVGARNCQFARLYLPIPKSADIGPRRHHQKLTLSNIVIQLRTTSAWGMDLAMTCTFFPHCMLTFAVVFGSTPVIETEILNRLALAPEDAAHPLLLPGIIAEIERVRHAVIAENSISKLESHVLELDAVSTDIYSAPHAETAMRNIAKRNEWLDMAYLKNHLVSWVTQLVKFINTAEEMSKTVFSEETTDGADIPLNLGATEHTKPSSDTREDTSSSRRNVESNKTSIPLTDLSEEGHEVEHRTIAIKDRETVSLMDRAITENLSFHPLAAEGYKDGKADKRWGNRPALAKLDQKALRAHLCRIGPKIATRASDLKDEYDDKIRDCKMRLEGMAMASQWVG